MPIRKLDNSTSRALGASQALIDPICVVKELLDNALDARATSISIDIHSHMLESIVVRDNGRGIAPDDRHLVAMPGCTSKIVSSDDLESIGGRSLGFRGQALASIAELSAALTICTRVEGELVGTLMTIDRSGVVTASETTSSPLGTVVKIVGFLHAHPVRKAEHERHAEKTLKRLKSLLQSYALARPRTRLALHVLGNKTKKLDFSYAPPPHGDIPDVVRSIFGTACASQCVLQEEEESGYNVAAFLPQVDAEVAKVRAIGTFVSVDGRPLASSKSFAKQILKYYHKAVQSANLTTGKDMFLLLTISCPERVYDANVEPAKDDLLFHNPQFIQNIVERVFIRQYLNTRQVTSDILKTVHLTHQTSESAPRLSPPQPPPATSIFESQKEPITVNSSQIYGNMYDYEIDDYDLLKEFASEAYVDVEEDPGETPADSQFSNPWVLAKLHAKPKSSTTGHTMSHQTTQVQHGLATPVQSSSPSRQEALLPSEPTTSFSDRPQSDSSPRSTYRNGYPLQASVASNNSGKIATKLVLPQDVPQGPVSSARPRLPQLTSMHARYNLMRQSNAARTSKPFKPPSRARNTTGDSQGTVVPDGDPFSKRSRRTFLPRTSMSELDPQSTLQDSGNRDIRDFTCSAKSVANSCPSIAPSPPDTEEALDSAAMAGEFERNMSNRRKLKLSFDTTRKTPRAPPESVVPLEVSTSIISSDIDRTSPPVSVVSTSLEETREASPSRFDLHDRISTGEGVYNVTVALDVTLEHIVRASRHIDRFRSLCRWGEDPVYCEHPALVNHQ